MIYNELIDAFDALRAAERVDSDAKTHFAERLARHAGMGEFEAGGVADTLKYRSLFWVQQGPLAKFEIDVMQRGGFDRNYIRGVLGQVFEQYGFDETARELYREAGWSQTHGTMFQPAGKVFDADGFPPLEMIIGSDE
jgi:hypothetical protein